MRFGFCSGSYTASSSAIADEECINLYCESVESQGAVVRGQPYGGMTGQGLKALLGTPGTTLFQLMSDSPVRGVVNASELVFVVAGATFYQITSGGVATILGTVANDGTAASIAFSSTQILIVSAGHAYCYTIATSSLVEVTSQLAGTPAKVEYGDSYFIVCFANSNKFQMSQILDGTTWPGLLVNEVSVFPENITSIIVNHRELWVCGEQHIQPYQNTGSDEVYDVIPGTLIEKGCIATFAPCLLDNSVFWIDEDRRGGRSAWRSNGYTPSRISTHAVEVDLATYSTTQIAGMVTYAYQDTGHLFWVLYIPGSQWSWVYDVVEGLWHKRAQWINGAWSAHRSWNHVYAFGKHLVGDWGTGKLWEMNMAYLTDPPMNIRRLRRSPTVGNEMQWVQHAQMTVDIDTGQGPQPPLKDPSGNIIGPQVMLRWSNDRGKTWSNEHWTDAGQAGEFRTRVVWRRLGRSRYRVYEMVVTDPVKWTIVDAYLETA